MLLLRGAMAFDPEKDVWSIKDAHIKLEVLKRVKEVRHYDEHKQ
jgi:hypothetical protein